MKTFNLSLTEINLKKFQYYHFELWPPMRDVVDVCLPVLFIHKHVNKNVETILEPIKWMQQHK